MRFFALLLVVGGLITACSDGTPTVASASSSGETSSGAGTSGKGPKRTGSSSPPGDPYGEDGLSSTSSSSGAITNGVGDLDAIESIKVSETSCNPPPSQCLDAQQFAVTLASGTMVTTRCVELAGDGGGATQNVDSSKVLSADALSKIKAALWNVRTSTTPVSGYDGPQWILEVTTKSGTKLYAQTSGCGPQAQMTQIASGWNELWELLRSYQ